VHFVHIDLNAQETGINAAETIRNQFGKLDLLICNSAIAGAGDGLTSKVNIEALETVMRSCSCCHGVSSGARNLTMNERMMVEESGQSGCYRLRLVEGDKMARLERHHTGIRNQFRCAMGKCFRNRRIE